MNPCLRLAAAMALLLSAATPFVPAAAADPAGALHTRVVALEGGRNFRELGGYPAADGRHVKWGLLYRSGALVGLTAHDYATLAARGIRVVCDFRATAERQNESSHWPAAAAPRVLSDDYQLDTASFLPPGDPRSWTAEAARASMAAAYPRMLAQFNGQYRRMFAELLAGHAPLAFHCTAGKDRTGLAAALLLTALGTPRATVIEDYLLTNQTLNPAALAGSKPNPANPLASLPPAVAKALLAADPSYINAALAVLDAHADGAMGYLRDELGLGAAEVAQLRRLYTEA